MGFSGLGQSNGGWRRGRYSGPGALSEMNIVPLVDVVLVLLIIFMITAQAMEYGLEIEVPKVKSTQTTIKDIPVLSIARDGTMKLNDQRLENINLLGPEVKSRFGDVKAIYVRCDKNVIMDVFVKVGDAAKRAGLAVNLVTQTEE
jgi:biopolymer transport protein ExbD